MKGKVQNGREGREAKGRPRGVWAKYKGSVFGQEGVRVCM